MENPTLALIGATGFIGRHLLEALAPQPVRVLVHGNRPAWLEDMEHVQAVSGDILLPDSLDQLLEGIPAVVNLAGQVGSTPAQDLDVNVRGSLLLAHACLRHRVRRVIHASSALVYGDTLNAVEDRPFSPMSPYAAMKASAERILQTALLPSVTLISLRLTNVYGPYQTKGLIPYLIGCLRNNRPVAIDADGAQVRDFVHVSDVVGAFQRAIIAGDREGAFNIGTGIATTVMRLLRLLEDLLDVPARGHYRPEHTGGERHNTVHTARAWDILGWQAGIGLSAGVQSCLPREHVGVEEEVGA